ncbi:MAG: hypothetical protein MJ252_28740 [archaeon]|nr:hypothetical protein [archaeon]
MFPKYKGHTQQNIKTTSQINLVFHNCNQIFSEIDSELKLKNASSSKGKIKILI